MFKNYNLLKIRQKLEKWVEGITDIECMLKGMIKSLGNRPLDPWPLESLDPLLHVIWRRTYIFNL